MLIVEAGNFFRRSVVYVGDVVGEIVRLRLTADSGELEVRVLLMKFVNKLKGINSALVTGGAPVEY